MSKIYTKTGDQGQTGLFGGGRVPKTHPRVAAYGDVDELNSCLGAALAFLDPSASMLEPELTKIQSELFVIGALLATPKDKLQDGLPEGAIARLELQIDGLSRDLKPMDRFILPGGGPSGAWLHVARTVCRRAERSVVAALAAREELPKDVLIYLNRLSDYLFTAARWTNAKQKRSETPWEGFKKAV